MITIQPTRLDRLSKLAGDAGLYVSIWSPGDATTRYRFASTDADYFAASSRHILHTAQGYKAAETWITAYRNRYLARH